MPYVSSRQLSKQAVTEAATGGVEDQHEEDAEGVEHAVDVVDAEEDLRVVLIMFFMKILMAGPTAEDLAQGGRGRCLGARCGRYGM
jgi:hypothetical protein